MTIFGPNQLILVSDTNRRRPPDQLMHGPNQLIVVLNTNRGQQRDQLSNPSFPLSRFRKLPLLRPSSVRS